MRRTYIYPHRSVRSFPLRPSRILTAVATAALLTTVIAFSGTTLLAAHGTLAHYVLRLIGIPGSGMTLIEVYPGLGPVSVPQIPFPHQRANPLRIAVLFLVSSLALIGIHRALPLSRNFIVFLLILLCSAAVVILLNPSFQFDSPTFEQIWLRGEILIWLILPWVSAFLFTLTTPSLRVGVLWSALIQVYAVIWSALRLAFCLGVFHYTGILFLPLLWFCLGVLFDLVYILVFYSWALGISMRMSGEERRT